MAITPTKKVGGKKRKGNSKAKKQMIYKLEGRLESNRMRRSRTERRKHIKLLRKHGIHITMDSFTPCGKCGKFAFTGEFCVSCGFKKAA